jgi:hypothetical protein
MDVSSILLNIKSCFCALLADSVGGAPATCCITAGTPAIADCCAGFAWVRLVNAYPTQTFPAHANIVNNCAFDTWALTVEVGVARCAAQPCDQAGNVCCDSSEAANDVLMGDFKAMRALFSCGCTGLNSREVLVGNWTVGTPSGGCLDSRLTAVVLTSGNCDCLP